MARSFARALGLAAAGSLAAVALVAQRPTGSIRGLVIDSLVGRGPLGGATVELAELGRVATTDGRGAFRFDSVPGGRYTLAFTHPTLAEIGFTPPDKIVQLGDGIDIGITLTTPSGESIYRRLCPGIREQATGVLLGTLKHARTGEPIAAGELRGEWVVRTLTRETGFATRPRAVRAATDSTGRFQLCGVPTDVPVLLKAIAAGVEGAPLDLRMGDKPIQVRHLTLDVDTTTTATARIVGSITSNGAPLIEAQVLVIGSQKTARTRADGSFELDGLPGGSHTVEARAIGHTRQRIAVDLVPGQAARVDLTLGKAAVELAEIKVTAPAAGVSGFDQRRRRATGGYFVTREEIVRRGPVRAEDIFRTIPGLRLEPVGAADVRIISIRGGAGFADGCEPTVRIDGIRIPVDPSEGLSLPLTPEEIEGIEFYPGPSTAPIEFRAVGENCGVILIWTRRGGRR